VDAIIDNNNNTMIIVKKIIDELRGRGPGGHDVA